MKYDIIIANQAEADMQDMSLLTAKIQAQGIHNPGKVYAKLYVQ